MGDERTTATPAARELREILVSVETKQTSLGEALAKLLRLISKPAPEPGKVSTIDSILHALQTILKRQKALAEVITPEACGQLQRDVAEIKKLQQQILTSIGR